jgi:hypothetical protein
VKESLKGIYRQWLLSLQVTTDLMEYQGVSLNAKILEAASSSVQQENQRRVEGPLVSMCGIGRSQPMQNDQTYFFSDILLKTLLYYKIINYKTL